MEKSKIFKLMLILATVIALTIADFLILGESIVMAINAELESQSSNTSVKNVEFDAYFNNGGNKSHSEIAQIGEEPILTLAVKVKEKGSLENGKIRIENSNFKIIKDRVDNSYIKSINEGANEIELNSIVYGDIALIELPIQFNKEEKFNSDYFERENSINLSGVYKDKKEQNVEGSKNTQVQWINEADVVVSQNIEKYKILEDKVVLQQNITTEVTDNSLPRESEILNVQVPNLGKKAPEKVTVLLNGKKVDSNIEDGFIKVNNTNKNAEGQSVWGNGRNEYKIIYTYNRKENVEAGEAVETAGNSTVIEEIKSIVAEGKEEVETKEQEIAETTDAEQEKAETTEPAEAEQGATEETKEEPQVEEVVEKIEDIKNTEFVTEVKTKLYTKEEIVKQDTKEIELNEMGNLVSIERNTTGDIDKGYLYVESENETIFQEVNTIEISEIDTTENIEITKEAENFINENNKIFDVSEKISYKSSMINKDEFIRIFGEDGEILIKDVEDKVIRIINKDIETDGNGNIQINYNKGTNNIKVATSKPVNEGKLNIYHTRAIKGETGYSKKQLKTFNKLVTSVKVITNQAEEVATSETKLNDTKTEATFKVNKDTLSTVISNNVEMKATLQTENAQDELYENPEIRLELPEEVESIEVNSVDMVYEDELQIADYTVEGNVIKLFLEGKQTGYKESAVEGANIIVNANVTVDKKSATNDSNIKMTVVNADEEVTKESPIKLVAPKDVTTIFSIPELGIETIGQEESVEVTLEKGQDATTITPQFEIINNNKEAIKDVKVLGTFPTNNETNNVNMKITEGITVEAREGIKVYYSENENATADLENSENGWTEGLDLVENTKKYLITIDEIASQESIQGSYKVEIPANLEFNQQAEQWYEVTYVNSATNVENTLYSTKVETTTGIGPSVEAKLTATVGGQELADNAVVKNGEVIRYKVEVKNVGTEEVENINLVAKVPEGTTMVVPEDDYEYSGPSYYKELDNKEYEDTIDKLTVEETRSFEYEVRVNKDVAVGTEIKNVSEIQYQDVKKQSNEIKNTTETATLRATAKRVTDRSANIMPGVGIKYQAIIENMTNEKQDNIIAKIKKSENLKLSNIVISTWSNGEIVETKMLEGDELTDIESTSEIKIGTLKTGETSVISCSFGIAENASNHEAINFSTVAVKGKEEVKANKVEDYVKIAEVSLNMETNAKNQYVEAGDIIEYTITAKNEGDFDVQSFNIVDDIPRSLEIKDVIVDGDGEVSTIDNRVHVSCKISKDETITIKIVTEVIEQESRIEEEPISNFAYAEYAGKEIATTSKIEHIIKAYEEQEPDEGNPEEPDGGNPEEPDGGNPEEPDGGNPEEPDGGNPEEPDGGNPEEPDGGNPEEPDGGNPEEPDGGDNNDIAKGNKKISGVAWLDENKNGKKDINEKTLNNVKAKVLNAETNNLVKDNNGRTIETVTNDKGIYSLDNLQDGKYIVIFEYDTTQYALTKYKVTGVSERENSDVMMNELNTEEGKQKVASTDIIKISEENIYDINLGLIRLSEFDLGLDKYVSKILIQNKAGTVVKEYNNSTLAKAEIGAKQVNGTTAIIEYKIQVTNNGEVDGYAKKIVDYLPGDLKFNSELNKDWYQKDGKLFTTSLANEKIAPGESKIVKLTLSKSMTEDNVGRTNNSAEIAESYNELGIKDINSTAGNRASGENDMGSAEVILSIRTGGIVYISIAIATVMILGVVIFIIMKRKDLKGII